MNQYEAMYVIDTQLEETARQELIARFNGIVANNGGTVDRVDEWGKRRLAYLVDDKPEGFYVLVNFSAEATFPKELERVMEIDENVMRYLVTRVEHKRSNVKPPQRVAPQAQSAEVPEPGLETLASQTEE